MRDILKKESNMRTSGWEESALGKNTGAEHPSLLLLIHVSDEVSGLFYMIFYLNGDVGVLWWVYKLFQITFLESQKAGQHN